MGCFSLFAYATLGIFCLLAVSTLVLGFLANTSFEGVSGTGVYSTYRYNLVFFAGPRAVRDDASFRAAQYETCSPADAGPRSSELVTQSWDSGTFYAGPVLQDRVWLNAWNFLPLIFTVSAICEVLRISARAEHGRAIRFIRWVEYALTSPFMLVIIALSGFQRDRTVLVLLATGQFALIFFGHTLELELEHAVNGEGVFRFWTVLVASWCVHLVLWLYVVLPLSTRTIHYALPCTGWSSDQFETFKVLFVGLVYGEFVLFSLFGTALPLAIAVQIPSPFKWTASTMRKLNLDDVWARQDRYYACLNFTAKVLLFSLITGIVFQMPPEVQFPAAS